ncbi:MAG TPA: two-component regulator propeller domain-containing protein, partial [Bacteroidales bacterium]|nr:two-component regulator propeller domain-containing protein [Bacteroidales bacterium]
MSQATVNCIFRDSKGFIWLGTNDGLNCYDAYSFRVYRHNRNDAFSISGNTITSIAEDSSSNLWIATRNNGLNYYNRKKNTFTRYSHVNGDESSLLSDNIKKVTVARNGTVLIGTLGAGLNIYLPEEKKFTAYTNRDGDKNSLSNNFVYSIVEEGDGKFWIGSDAGTVDLFDTKSGTFKKYRYKEDYRNASSDIGVSLLKDKSGDLWIGTNRNGLYKLTVERGQIAVINGEGSVENMNDKIFTSFVAF